MSERDRNPDSKPSSDAEVFSPIGEQRRVEVKEPVVFTPVEAREDGEILYIEAPHGYRSNPKKWGRMYRSR